MGVNHSTQGTETVNAICNLALLTGQHRPRRRVAVLDHRPVQRDGHARSGIHVQSAGLSQIRQRGRIARNWPRSGASTKRASRQARPGLSGHHRGGGREEDSRAVDHRDQSAGFLPQSGCAAAGALESRLPGRAGRLSSHADHRTGRPGAAGRDLGRKRRHLHQLRTARQQGQQGGRAAGRSALGFRHLSRASPKSSAAAKNCFPAGRTARTRSTNGGASRRDGCATTPASATTCWPSTARCSGRCRKGRSACRRRGSMPMASSRRRTAGPSWSARSGQPFPEQPNARLPVHSQYRPHRGALAHAHEDARGADSRAAVAARVARNESARCEEARAAQPRSGGRGLAARPRARSRTAAHRNHRAGAGVHAVPFRGNQRERGDAERLRSHLARAELQAVRGAGGARRSQAHEASNSSWSATEWPAWPASSRS